MTTRRLGILLVMTALLLARQTALAQQVRVRYAEGLVHGFLVLKTLAGDRVADGELIQTARGDRVTARLVFRFVDGSVHDETTVFSQRQSFRVLQDHLVQKGPSFQHPLDMTIDARTGQVTVKYADDHGEQKVASEKMAIPPDLANGLVPILLKNVRPGAPPFEASLIAATPKPRLVKLQISQAGDDRFTTGGTRRMATRYVVKVKIGGFAGVVAPLVGKEPPDSHVWVMHGDAPAFVKAEQPFAMGGPVWRIELVGPTW